MLATQISSPRLRYWLHPRSLPLCADHSGGVMDSPFTHQPAPFRTSGSPTEHFSVRLSDVREQQNRIAFTATFTDYATDRWTGQDWVVIPTDDSSWQLPDNSSVGRRTNPPARSFKGQLQPVPETMVHEYTYLYEFDPRTALLSLWDGSGYVSLGYLSRDFYPRTWMLAARLLSHGREVSLIPILQFTLEDNNSYTYNAYEATINAMLIR